MKYLGSKSRIAKEILPLILADRKEGQYFVEPFCGGCNVTVEVSGNRIANDYNQYLIAMFRGLLSGAAYPEKINRELYNDVRACFRSGSDKYDIGFIGWVGFMASYNGRFFDGGYSGAVVTAEGNTRDYISEQIKNTMAQIPNLHGVDFRTGDYKDLRLPDESIIYCDPPYKDTKGYTFGLEHDEFWQWCRERVYDGHKVYISEYQAPNDFIKIWERPLRNNMNPDKKATERLFIYKGQF